MTRSGTRVLRRLAAPVLLLAVATGMLAPAAAAATTEPTTDPTPAATAQAAPEPGLLRPTEGAYFGSSLDWSVDTAAEQADRLGRPAGVLEHSATVPITEAEVDYLGQFLQQARGEGALGAVTLRPSGDLAGFGPAEAEAAVDALDRARGDDALPLYVRFAPDMNGNWNPWGQRPTEYVAAFRAFSDALHAGLPAAVAVWSPAAGESYPFQGTRGAEDGALDTDGDGLLGSGDDPYGPYYPGDDVVDWVGLSAYHDPSGGGAPVNAVPTGGELAADLAGEGDLDFTARFSTATGAPMLLETAAFVSPGIGGPSAVEIKQAWWRQVIAAVDDDGAYPLLDVVLWRDSSSTRATVGEVVIDWSISNDRDVAAAFRADAEASGLLFGPLYDPLEAGDVVPPGGGTVSGIGAWLIVAGVLLATVALTAWGLTRGRRSRWAYAGPPNRDLRIDLLRGVAIVFVVVNHVGLVSLLQNGTQEAVGMVSGAELFVLLSGAVLGLVYRPKVVGGDLGEVTLRTGRRAWKLYVTALVVVLIVGGLSLLPFLNTTPVTTYVDQGTGAAGSGATGRVYDLYANFGRILSYPVDPSIIIDLASLRLGPWQVNVLGLYVVMLAIAPLIFLALSRRRWLLVLAVSWGLYVLQAFLRIRLLPSQFEDSFPLLTWQALFTTGMVAGFYRREILVWFATRFGRIVLAVGVVATVLLAIFSWNNPYLSSSADLRLGLVPGNTFSSIYTVAFERTTLDAGRVLNVFLVTITAYALLSVLWRPISRLTGWFFVPLGQATLYVFVMHVFFVLIAANVPVLREGDIILDTLAYVVILGLLWTMVKTRFLFGLVPR